jgi:hypothetical protein
MLNKELGQFSESSKSGNQISEYIFTTFLGKCSILCPISWFCVENGTNDSFLASKKNAEKNTSA